MKAFEARGSFFLPTDPKSQVPGTLSLLADRGLILSLAGTLGAEGLSSRSIDSAVPLVHGIVSGGIGSAATIWDVQVQSSSRTSSGLVFEESRIGQAILGPSHLPLEPRFGGGQVIVEGFEEWLEWDAIVSNRSKMAASPNALSFQIRPEQAVAISAPGFEALKIRQIARVTESRQSMEATVRIAFEATTEVAVPVDWWLRSFVSPMRNFVAFLVGSPQRVDEISLFKPEGRRAPAVFRLLADLIEPDERALRRRRPSFLSSQGVDIGLILERWLAFSERHPEFCAVYFGSRFRPEPFVEQRLDSTITALSLLLGSTPKDVALANSVSQEIERLLPEEVARLIGPTSLDLAFPTSLAESIAKLQPVIEPMTQKPPEAFVSEVLKARRFVRTREASLLEEGAGDLFWVNEILQLLVVALVYIEIGIPVEVVRQSLESHPLRDYIVAGRRRKMTPEGD
jgi:hypothetical protein